MIWEKEKKVRLEVIGEELNVVFDIPNAMDVEWIFEMVRKEDRNTDSKVFSKFVTHVDGFNSAEDFVKTPGTSKVVKIISGAILDAASLDVQLKNESGSSTV